MRKTKSYHNRHSLNKTDEDGQCEMKKKNLALRRSIELKLLKYNI